MFLALICDFSQFIKIPLSKTTKTGFYEYLQIYYLWTCESEVSERYINLFSLEILFLLTYDTQAKDIAVVKTGTRNDFRSSWLYDTLKKLSP